MAKPQRATARSTDALPRALDFRHIGGGQALLENVLSVSGAKAIEGKLGDPAWVDSALSKLNGGALAILEILVDAGGGTTDESLARLCRDRLGLEAAPVAAARVALERAGLAIGVESSSYGRPKATRKHLFSHSSALIAARVRGLTLPKSTPPADIVGSPSHLLRDRVARLAATAHVPIRATASGSANRTSLKKLAPLVGLSVDELDALFDLATAAGWLGERDGVLLPRAAAMRAVARGEVGASVFEAWALARVADGAWLSVDALARAWNGARAAYLPDELDGRSHFDLTDPDAGRAPESAIAQQLRNLPTLATIEHAGAWFVRRPIRREGGDGHVTPSFEVMLGPACDPELALSLSLAAEPVRFDKVLTLKLTPASIAAASALGVDADHIVGALERVGRHGLPDNVRAMVRDWLKGARRVSIRKAWVLEASSVEAADLAARGLGSNVISRPSPTTVVVDEKVSSPAASLTKVGVATDGDISLSPRCVRPSETAPIAVPFAPPEPKPELTARFLADRGAGTLATLVEPEEHDDVEDGPAGRLMAAARNQPAGAATVRLFLERVAKLWSAASDEYVTWSEHLRAVDGPLAQIVAIEAPLRFLPFLVRTPKERRRLLRASSDVTSLMERAERTSGATLDGDVALRMTVQYPEVQAFVMAELESARAAIDALEQELPPSSSSSSTSPAPSKGAPAAGRPRPGDLAEQPAALITEQLHALVSSTAPAWVRVRSKSQGDRVVRLRVERVLVRGSDVTVLGTDLDDEVGRSFPIANVVAVRAL
jgi:hypothetical protein